MKRLLSFYFEFGSTALRFFMGWLTSAQIIKLRDSRSYFGTKECLVLEFYWEFKINPKSRLLHAFVSLFKNIGSSLLFFLVLSTLIFWGRFRSPRMVIFCVWFQIQIEHALYKLHLYFNDSIEFIFDCETWDRLKYYEWFNYFSHTKRWNANFYVTFSILRQTTYRNVIGSDTVNRIKNFYELIDEVVDFSVLTI